MGTLIAGGGFGTSLRRLIEQLVKRRVVETTVAYVVAGWVLVQVVDTTGDAIGLPPWALTFVVISLAVGFPIVIVLSWFFALTPQGIQPEQDATMDAPWQAGRLTYVVIAMLAAALAVSLWTRDTPPTTAVEKQTVAVLPFASDNARDAEFVSGLHEDLITQLSRIRTLRVISRTSVVRYAAASSLPIAGVSSQLNADSLLRGSVQRLTNRLRVSVELIDAKTEQVVWDEVFDRRLTANDVFAIQGEIAVAVADALEAALTKTDRKRLQEPRTESLEAYSTFLRGKLLIEKRTSETLEEAIELLRRSIELDPQFAAAHAQLAIAYDLASWYGDLSREDMLLQAMPHARRAIDIDPTLAEGWTALADLRAMSNDLLGAEEAFLKAIEINPNYPLALHWYALLVTDQGDIETALALHEQALALDPLSVTLSNNVAQDLYFLDRRDEALVQYERSLALDPNFAATHAHMANLYGYAFGRPDEGLGWVANAARLDPRHTEYPSQIAMLLLDLDTPEAAGPWAQRALSLGEKRWWPNLASLLHAQRTADEDAVRLHAERMLALFPQSALALAALRDLDIAAGKVEDALSRYTIAVPDLMQTPVEIDSTNAMNALNLARVYIELGQSSEANALLEASRPAIVGQPRTGTNGIGFADIELLAMLGNSDEAMSLLTESVASEWTQNWWLSPINANLSSLHDDERFTTALAQMRQRASAFRTSADIPELPPDDKPATE